MATKKFSELTTLDIVNANLELTVIPVLDTSSGTTRKVTLQQINDSIEANIPFAAAAFTQANTAFLQSISNYTSAVTKLDVTSSGSSAYLIDQYSGNNPSIYVSAGETISFNLNVSGHPFLIRESSGGVNTSSGLTHISTTGVVSTGSSAQGKETGVLYWKVPFSLIGSTYVYQCAIHGGMIGNIIIQQPVSFVAANTISASSYANAAFVVANTANVNSISASEYANAAFAVANNGITDSWARDTANAASSYANSSYSQANTANTLAQAAFNAANNVNVSGNTGNVTFSNQVVQGTGDEYGGGGLYLAPGPNSTSNLQYLRVRGGDAPTHIHLDTGNNSYYDQYFGDDGKYVKLGADGVISIGTNYNVWSFGANSNLIFPDSSTQNTAYTGLSKFSTVTTSTHTFNELTEDILFCDPNSAGSQISIYLPDSIANGKSFTVKNINSGGNVVYVQVQTGNTPLEIETGSVGTFNYANIANTGSSITWLFDGTTYRIINEVIR